MGLADTTCCKNSDSIVIEGVFLYVQIVGVACMNTFEQCSIFTVSNSNSNWTFIELNLH